MPKRDIIVIGGSAGAPAAPAAELHERRGRDYAEQGDMLATVKGQAEAAE